MESELLLIAQCRRRRSCSRKTLTIFNWHNLLKRNQMSEELSNPSLNVPRAMVWGVLINGLMGFAMLLACLFCLGDPDAVFGSGLTAYPFIAIFFQAIGSVPGTLTMAAIITIMVVCASMTYMAAASRMTWSFARDRGLPGWHWLSAVSDLLCDSV